KDRHSPGSVVASPRRTRFPDMRSPVQLNLFTPMAKRSSKWIDGLRPEMGVSQAARKTLRRRLEAVWFLLKPAAEKADQSPEHVHQLRVSTRRAMAALEGYAELLPRAKAE